ncbi:MAG: polysulfide reductase NrfD [Deltaproteobacteria bacterium]|nr:polysulfide reductase NrfD [Deltaproteobacteria bacterium]
MAKADVLRNSPAFSRGVLFLLLLAVAGLVACRAQLSLGFQVSGLAQTGLPGLYEGQFMFFSGIGAGLAAARLYCRLSGRSGLDPLILWFTFCVLLAALSFSAINLGRPERFFYIFRSHNFSSLRFWVSLALLVYLFITVLSLAGFGRKYLMFPAVFLASAIPVLNGLLYQGMSEGRFHDFPLHSALLAPRFLASAVSCGLALLLLGLFLLRNFARFDLDAKFVKTLAAGSACALALNVFFYILGAADAFYNLSAGRARFLLLFFGGGDTLRFANIAMWLSAVLALLALLLLLLPRTRGNMHLLPWSLAMIPLSALLEQGLNFNAWAGYTPSLIELLVSAGLVSACLALFGTGGRRILRHALTPVKIF